MTSHEIRPLISLLHHNSHGYIDNYLIYRLKKPQCVLSDSTDVSMAWVVSSLASSEAKPLCGTIADWWRIIIVLSTPLYLGLSLSLSRCYFALLIDLPHSVHITRHCLGPSLFIIPSTKRRNVVVLCRPVLQSRMGVENIKVPANQ